MCSRSTWARCWHGSWAPCRSAAPLEGRSDRGARQAKPGAGSPRRGARDGGGAAVRTSVKIISGANAAQDERQTGVATDDGVESSFLRFLRRNRARKRVLAGVPEKESGSKYRQGYTPFTTFPLFLLLFSLFFSLSSPPSSTVGEKLPLFLAITSTNTFPPRA